MLIDTLLPKFAALKHDELVIISLKGEAPVRELGLLWRKSDSRLALFKAISRVMIV